MCHLVFLCNLFDSYVYIILFQMEEKPVFDLIIKHVPSVHGCNEQFCGARNSL